jgi:hypothetical protein
LPPSTEILFPSSTNSAASCEVLHHGRALHFSEDVLLVKEYVSIGERRKPFLQSLRAIVGCEDQKAFPTKFVVGHPPDHRFGKDFSSGRKEKAPCGFPWGKFQDMGCGGLVEEAIGAAGAHKDRLGSVGIPRGHPCRFFGLHSKAREDFPHARLGLAQNRKRDLPARKRSPNPGVEKRANFGEDEAGNFCDFPHFPLAHPPLGNPWGSVPDSSGIRGRSIAGDGVFVGHNSGKVEDAGGDLAPKGVPFLVAIARRSRTKRWVFVPP